MKQHLLGIAAAIAVAGLISLSTARRIEAQFSSPVKVVNTTSAPAITSRMDDPGGFRTNRSSTACQPAGGILFAMSNFHLFPPVIA